MWLHLQHYTKHNITTVFTSWKQNVGVADERKNCYFRKQTGKDCCKQPKKSLNKRTLKVGFRPGFLTFVQSIICQCLDAKYSSCPHGILYISLIDWKVIFLLELPWAVMAESGNLFYHLPITVIVLKLHEASSTVESDTKGTSELHSHATEC